MLVHMVIDRGERRAYCRKEERYHEKRHLPLSELLAYSVEVEHIQEQNCRHKLNAADKQDMQDAVEHRRHQGVIQKRVVGRDIRQQIERAHRKEKSENPR